MGAKARSYGESGQGSREESSAPGPEPRLTREQAVADALDCFADILFPISNAPPAARAGGGRRKSPTREPGARS